MHMSRAPLQLNFVRLCLIFVVPQYGAQNFEVSSRFLENLCTLDVHYYNQLRNCVIGRCITSAIAQYSDE